MRGRVRSGILAFGYGLLLASGVGAAAVATHVALAPPGPDAMERALVSRLVVVRQELGAYAEGWATILRDAIWSQDAAHQVIGTAHAAMSRVHQEWVSATGEGASRRLIIDIQTELQRLGCYAGRLDGVWTESARVAAAAFTRRTEVRLTFTEPDWLLLTMLQGHSGPVCGDTREVETAVEDRSTRTSPASAIPIGTIAPRLDAPANPAANGVSSKTAAYADGLPIETSVEDSAVLGTAPKAAAAPAARSPRAADRPKRNSSADVFSTVGRDGP